MQKQYFKALFFLLLFYFNSYAQLPQCERGVNFADLDINNVRARHWASGSMWFDPFGSEPHYEIPKGSNQTMFFSFDFWFGAVDEMGRRRTDFQTYAGNQGNTKYFPGPLNDIGDTFVEICEHYDRVWKINKSTIDSFRLGLLSEIPKDILEWPAHNNPHITYSPENELAPFIDVNGDQNYNPMDGDFPEILGDQTLWWVFNDKGGYGSPFADRTLQIDGQGMAYAYNSIPELQNHTFYRYTFTNKSNLRLDSVIVGMFADVDLGQFDDDFMGCDTLRNMAIAYNGDAYDGDYGEDIPMIGLKLLRGLQKGTEEHSGMYTFWTRPKTFSIWGIPETFKEAFFALRGLSDGGSPMTYGGVGYGGETPTLFMFPSDPTDEEGWSECSENNPPAERKFMIGTGPITLEHLESATLDFAVLWTDENVEYPCPSFAPIQEVADYVQDLFDNEILTNIEEKPTSTNSKSSIHLFPNPAAENTILSLEQNPNQAFQTGEWKLFDATGKLMGSVTLKASHRNEWKFSGLPSGIYFYQLQWENGSMESGKWVVQ